MAVRSLPPLLSPSPMQTLQLLTPLALVLPPPTRSPLQLLSLLDRVPPLPRHSSPLWKGECLCWRVVSGYNRTARQRSVGEHGGARGCRAGRGSGKDRSGRGGRGSYRAARGLRCVRAVRAWGRLRAHLSTASQAARASTLLASRGDVCACTHP